MQCGVIGIHARNTSLALREVFTKACQRVLKLQDELSENLSLVSLLTCNRVELYFSSEDLAFSHSLILAALREEIPLGFESHLYSLFGIDCFSHLVQVTSGLDSVIVGETDIQGQVKKAYNRALGCYLLTSDMHFLFQKSLKLAKEIRNSEDFPKSRYRLEEMVVDLIQHSPALVLPKVLLVGNSAINKKIAFALNQRQIAITGMLTRSYLEEQSIGCPIFNWDKSHSWVDFDVVISATTSSDYLLKKEDLINASNKSYLLFDLSVPRTIEPSLELLPAVHLFNMEKINSMLEKEKLLLEDKIENIRNDIQLLVERQEHFFRKRNQKALLCFA